MAISNLLSGRVRLKGPKNVTSDRYEFVDLSQVEPNFGVPTFSASLDTNPAILVTDSEGNRGFAQKIVLSELTSSFKGIADLSGSFSGSFSGNALLSGSFGGQFGGSFTGSFVGDGSQLTNVPSTVAPRIASGSATASISPNLGLVVNTNTTIQGNLYVSQSIFAEQLIVSYVSSSIIYSSGSNKFGDEASDRQEFTGSVRIQNNLIANEVTASSYTGSFVGDGSQLTNIPALTAPRIASGSATASISPNLGLQVNTFAQFELSVSASMFSGSGRGLFDIPRSALTPDALVSTLIASGSVTASVTPESGLVVKSTASGSTFSGVFLWHLVRSLVVVDNNYLIYPVQL